MESAQIRVISVLRFIPPSENDNATSAIHLELEKVLSNSVNKHFRSSGFSISISKSIHFEDHLDSLRKFVSDFSKYIDYANANNIQLEFDIGFSNHSLSEVPVSCRVFSKEDLKTFYENGIQLEITIYWP